MKIGQSDDRLAQDSASFFCTLRPCSTCFSQVNYELQGTTVLHSASPFLRLGTCEIKTILIPLDRLKVDIDTGLSAFSFSAKPVPGGSMTAFADSSLLRRGSASDHRSSATLRVTVVMPTCNVAQSLPHVLPRIPSWVSEIILVDGHSTDETVEVARRLIPNIQVVMQTGQGKGNALRAGFAAATGDIIVMIDADGSTDPEEMGMFVRYLRSGADFVKGSRFLQGAGTSDMTGLRMLGNKGLTMLTNVLFGGRYSDVCYGYNAFWRDVLPVLQLDTDGFEIETLMNIRALRVHLKVLEIHSFEAARLGRRRNVPTFLDGWRVLKTIIRERLRGQPRLLPAKAVTMPLVRHPSEA
jgi:Glycosyl transferase family 2